MYGISIDSQFAHKVFAQMLGLEFLLLSDANRLAATQFEVIRPELAGIKNVANRAVFVIKPDSTIAFKWITENPPEVPDVKEVLGIVQGLA